jgi:hypothetical protein
VLQTMFLTTLPTCPTQNLNHPKKKKDEKCECLQHTIIVF